ncbi:hypothetical protein M3J09_001864 [Ascochyta lentis]
MSLTKKHTNAFFVSRKRLQIVFRRLVLAFLFRKPRKFNRDSFMSSF